MTDAKPILFSGPMVRAILAGTKSQTRRLVRYTAGGHVQRGKLRCHPDDPEAVKACQYGGVGGHAWVKETWRPFLCDCGDLNVRYAADDSERFVSDWDIDADWAFPQSAHRGNVPRIFMPRWASRITLEITNVRIERLHAITAEDIIAEGAVARAHHDQDLGLCPVSAFDGKAYMDLLSLWAAGWDAINGKRAPWSSNPRVWVRTFRRVA